jgi:hydrogenase maturation protease
LASLVIGYGNDLRSDDGAGRVVADRIEAMRLPGVAVHSVMQLTPELALDIAGAEVVVFVDASVDVAKTTMVDVVAEPAPRGAMTHYSTPGSLIEMTASVGRIPQRAVAISIPVTDLGLGTELTPSTELGVEEAVSLILGLLGN